MKYIKKYFIIISLFFCFSFSVAFGQENNEDKVQLKRVDISSEVSPTNDDNLAIIKYYQGLKGVEQKLKEVELIISEVDKKLSEIKTGDMNESSKLLKLSTTLEELRASLEKTKILLEKNLLYAVDFDEFLNPQFEVENFDESLNLQYRVEDIEKTLENISYELKKKHEIEEKKLILTNKIRWQQVLLFLILIALNNIILIWYFRRKQKQQQTDLMNPYKAGQALGKGDWFFGRADILDSIENNLLTAEIPHSITIYGVRRMGKSSILKRIHYMEQYLSVYITFDDIAILIESNEDFFIEVQEAIQKDLSNQDFPSPKQKVKDKKSFEDFLFMLDSSLDNRRLVIMLDEFQKVDALIEEGKLSQELLGFLRNMLQELKNIGFIFCGTDAIKDMTAGYFSAFFNLTLSQKVSFLNKKDAIDLIVKPLEGQIKYHTKVVERIIQLTNGQPYFVQLICHELVSEAKSKSAQSIKPRDLDKVINNLLNKGEAYFSHVIKTSALRKLLLSIIADQVSLNQYISLDDILNKLSNYKINNIQKEDVLDALRNLCERDLLEEDSTKLQFRFTINLIRLWLVKKLPIAKVMDEYENRGF